MSTLVCANANISGSANVGANVWANTTALQVGNSSANLIVNSTAIQVGNSTINAVVNSSGFQFLGSTLTTGAPTMQVFTANGTWTRPSGCRKIKVIVVGGRAGGGGPGSGGSTGTRLLAGGGGGGGWAIKFIDVTAVSSQTVTVGLGGSGGNTTATGLAGGTSTFGSYHSATGGAAVANGSASGGVGGAGSSGDINGTGDNGGVSIANNLLNASNSTYFVSYFSGSGGGSLLGGFAQGQISLSNLYTTAVGQNGTVYGCGGAGNFSNSTVANSAGNGNGGIIIVEEFY